MSRDLDGDLPRPRCPQPGSSRGLDASAPNVRDLKGAGSSTAVGPIDGIDADAVDRTDARNVAGSGPDD